jgi:hypothetical protein
MEKEGMESGLERSGEFLQCLFGNFSEYTHAQKMAVELKVYQS